METAKKDRAKLLNIAPRFGATDFDEAAAFYEIIGFHVGYRDDGFMILECDEVAIHMNLFDEPPKRSVCWITVTRIEELYDRWLSKGIVRGLLEKKEYGVKEFVVCDPFGHLLIFAEPIE